MISRISHFLPLLALAAATTAYAGIPTQINEIRIDQPGGDDDEYFELVGVADASLDGLTYIVIGDNDDGTIEAVVDLTGQTLDSNGLFVAAESTFTLGTADLTTSLNFENSDNVTHVLVDGFTGADGDDLDTDNDGTLDSTPWSAVIDAVGLVEEPNPPSGTEFVYGASLGFVDVGPDGSFVPAHVFRCTPDGTFTIGGFDPVGGDDTPGMANPACPLPIANLDTGETFATIQEAIDDADTDAGDTIEVQVAEHTEAPRIDITKSITLQGSGGTTVVAGGDTGSSGDDRAWFLVPAGVVVTVQDLTFDGDSDNSTQVFQAWRIVGSGSFTNCGFQDIRFQQYLGFAVVAFGDGPVDINGCNFNNIERVGGLFFGPGASGSVVSNCSYTGKGDGDFIDYFLDISAGIEMTVQDCMVSENRGVASSDGSNSAGILVSTFFASGTVADITGCTFSNNTHGVFVGFDDADTSEVNAMFNNFINNTDHGVISTSDSVVTQAKENFWNDAAGPNDPNGTVPAVNNMCAPVETIVNMNPPGDAVDTDGPADGSEDNVCYCPWAEQAFAMPTEGSLTLEVANLNDSGCAGDDQVTVEVYMRDLTGPATGFQAFVEFDDSVLTFNSGTYTDDPFPAHIQEPITAVGGMINLDGSEQPGSSDGGTAQDSLLATLVFDVDTACSTTSLNFTNFGPFESELSFQGMPIPTTLVPTGDFFLDSTPPTITCPDPITAPAEAGSMGGCDGATVEFTATAEDNCDGMVDLSCTPPSGSFFPAGSTTVTCTATDDCGNESTCTFDVTVEEVNTIEVTVELPGSVPTSRCIHFEADGSAVTDTVLTFIDHDSDPMTPVRAEATIEVDCGDYSFLCAKDQQHTKWDTTTLSLSGDGTSYIADMILTLDPGDNDNDGDVDINDVTFLITTFGDPATPGGCPYNGTRDADFNNGGAVGSDDYSLISGEFLTVSGCNDPAPLMARNFDGRTSVPTTELDPRIADHADLVRDGVINWRDVRAFEAANGLANTLSRTIREAETRSATR